MLLLTKIYKLWNIVEACNSCKYSECFGMVREAPLNQCRSKFLSMSPTCNGNIQWQKGLLPKEDTYTHRVCKNKNRKTEQEIKNDLIIVFAKSSMCNKKNEFHHTQCTKFN